VTVLSDAPGDAAGSPAAEIVEPNWPATERSPVQLLSLVTAAAAFLLALLIAQVDKDALFGLESDTLRYFDELPDALERFLIGASQFTAVVYPLILAVAFLALRRWRPVLIALLGAAFAAGVAFGVNELLDRPEPPELAHARTVDTWIVSARFPSYLYIAGAAAAAVVVGAYVGRRWRFVAWSIVGFVALFRILSGTELPVTLALAATVGWAVGAGALLVFGVPTHRSTGREVADALARSGLPLRQLAPASVDARGSTPWFGTTRDGGRIFVKALGRDERDADLLFRIYRFFRLRNVGDQRPFSTLRRSVEHEALVALKARDVGIRTPHLLTLATCEPNGFLLAYAMVDGASLDRVPQPWSDDLLRGIWEQVALLRHQRIAHRDLRRANVFVDTDGAPWIIDFGFSELAVTDEMLAQDLAQLLAALAVDVGALRAVDSAVAVLGAAVVATALPYLQPAAFANATRTALKENKGLLDELRNTVKQEAHVEDVQYEPLHRFSIRTVFMLVGSLIALYVLIPQFADVEGMFKQLKDANWALVGIALFFSALSYVGAGISLLAACPVPVRPASAVEVSLAGSFVNRITPAGIGGIGLNLRFMQKAGANTTEAASRWGVNALLGGVVHFSLAALFVLWAGKSGAFDFHPPKMPLLVAFAVVCVLAGVVFITPFGRRRLLGPAARIAAHAWEGVRSIASEPSRLCLMILGGAMVTLSYLFSLYASVRAFGGTTSLAAVGAIYLTGSAVGQAAPTPGGLGAVEAIVIAALVSAGLEKEIAVPAVLLWRLCTYWIPILPGWGAFARLSHAEII
jgi:undecaprenyl-diphosphatase